MVSYSSKIFNYGENSLHICSGATYCIDLECMYIFFGNTKTRGIL